MDELYKIPEHPEYSEEIRKIQDSDPVRASSVVNPVIQRLIENTAAVRRAQVENTKNIAALLHKCPVITGFTLSPPVAELGDEVSVAVRVTLDRAARELRIMGAGETLRTAAGGTEAECTVPNISAATVFQAVAVDELDHEISQSRTLPFYNGVYTGVGGESVELERMTKVLQSGRARTFSVNAGAGQYIWYACPVSMGTPAFYLGSPFEGGAVKTEERDYTNLCGHTEKYQFWRSVHPNLGSMTVEVR